MSDGVSPQLIALRWRILRKFNSRRDTAESLNDGTIQKYINISYNPVTSTDVNGVRLEDKSRHAQFSSGHDERSNIHRESSWIIAP